MAENTKKYLDLDGLGIFWTGIKKAYTDADTALETALKTAYENADKDLGKRIDDLSGAVEGNNTTLTNKLNTLIGSDADKSIRQIASLEIASQLIPENADKSLNELREIAAWIQQHPEDAAAMNKSISDNATAIQTNATAIEDEVTARTNAINGLQTTVSGKVDKSTYDAKIKSLDNKDNDFESRIAELEEAGGSQEAINTEKKAREDQDDKIEASVGLTSEGNYPKSSTSNTNYIKDADTVIGAVIALDGALKTHADLNITSFENVNAAISNEIINRKADIAAAINGLNIGDYATDSDLNAVKTEVDTIEASVGLAGDGNYPKSSTSNTNYIKDATTVMGAIVALDGALKAQETSNGSTYATKDELGAVEDKVDAIGVITDAEIAGILAS